ncbi:MAG: cyclase family protein [Bacteroidetes bacterium]|nr:cyclase family protein [Bacteroidota bacterium]
MNSIKAIIVIDTANYAADMTQPIDISIPLRAGENNVNAWWAKPVTIEPVVMGDFIGDVNQGGAVNFKDIKLNPHGNGTHTECVGHIAKENYTINQCLRKFVFVAQLISIEPQLIVNGDYILSKENFDGRIMNNIDALVIRTLPNEEGKLNRQYSGSNFPYIHHEAITYLVEAGINHLLIDLPSIDREQDDGQLLGHHAFWQYPNKVRAAATITELIYVPDSIEDGMYLLNIQITSLESDASPSKILLYKLNQA